MIDKDAIKAVVEEWLKDNDYFLVDVNVTPDERIVVEIDCADGVWIEDCAQLSRYLQEQLGQQLDDYELEVGSAGIGQPFKVPQQYTMHIGKDVEVLTNDGKKVRGTLQAVDGRQFTVAMQQKQRVEGKKRPVMATVEAQFSMDEVKYTKHLLNFK